MCIHRIQIIVLVIVVPLLLSGCTGHIHMPYAGSAVSQPEALAGSGRIYPYDRALPVVTNSDLDAEESSHYRVKHLGFDSASRNGQLDSQVDVLWYLGKNPGPKPTVIILPIWGSYTYPSNRISAGLRKLGGGAVNVLQVLGDSWVLDWDELSAAPTEEAFLELMANNLDRIRTNVIDTSRLVDWAVTRPEIDPDRIGLVGFSHSGITASLAAINDDRLKAAVIVMAGAHPHRVFASCRGRVGDLRKTVMSRFHWTVGAYQAALEPITRPIDAANYPGRADPSRILMFDAAGDQCFPVDARDALWKVLGEPERYTIAYGHKISFFAMTPLGFNWMRQPVYDFLDMQLGISGPS